MSSFEENILDLMVKEIQGKRMEVDFADSQTGIWKEMPVGFIEFCREWVCEPLFEGTQEEFAEEVIGTPTPEKFWSDAKKVALLFWGKGSGKGSVSAKLLTYAGYLLKLMRNPRAYFKIGNTAPIHMLNVSYNSKQAKEVFFQGYLVPMVLNTINPKTKKNFFAEQGIDLRVNDGDILSDTIHFERPTGPGEGGISAISMAGDKGTSEGYSPLIIFVDEISAMQNPIKAEKLVDDLEKSAQSRFNNYYKLIIASFKQGKNCLMSLKFQEAEEKRLPDTYFSRASTWEVNRNKSKEMFSNMYDKNPVKAARSYECREIEGEDENVFFKLQDRLRSAFLPSEYNPIIGDVEGCRTDQLKILEFKPWFKPRPELIYYIHVDLAKGTHSDRGGIGMVHKEGMESLKAEELQQYINGEIPDKQFKIKTDLVLQLDPNETRKQIILDEVRQFIIKLYAMGFRIEVTLDGYQSLDFIQQLESRGIKAELLSLDRNRQPYDSLQSVIYRRNLEIYWHAELHREASELEESEDGRKIDHPQYSTLRAKTKGIKEGSKDVVDSLCGAVYKAILAPSPNIPIMPSTKPSVHYQDEYYQELDAFERTVNRGMIQFDNRGKPVGNSQTGWQPLMPSKF